MLGGYFMTDISSANGGEFQMMALVQDQDGNDTIEKVEIYHQNMPTGVDLPVYDQGSGLYWLQGINVDPGVPTTWFMLEMIASDEDGLMSDIWPYMHIHPGSAPAPSMAFMEENAQVYVEDWRDLMKGVVSQGLQDSATPIITVGGYFDSKLYEDSFGRLTFMCHIYDPNGPDDVQSVEVLYNYQGTGLELFDDGAHNDIKLGDSIYANFIDIQPGALSGLAGSYEFQIMATDYSGNKSDVWPYMIIKP